MDGLCTVEFDCADAVELVFKVIESIDAVKCFED